MGVGVGVCEESVLPSTGYKTIATIARHPRAFVIDNHKPKELFYFP